MENTSQKNIQSPRGTRDLLPDQIVGWQFLEKVFSEVAQRFGYQEIRTPIFEHTEVFSRVIGENTDVVSKEMYSFQDKGEKYSLTLRPEMTAGAVRAAVQHNLTATGQLQRLWYIGPQFRYERPQAGRFRQFYQCGAECYNASSPESDAELIMFAAMVLQELGLSQYTLHINTLGTAGCREQYVQALVQYLEEKKELLSHDSQVRLTKNPLRILDSKDRGDKAVLKDAPILSDYLSEESKQHFTKVLSILEANGYSYTIAQSLVRGLDYYSHTVFEFTSSDLGSQDALGGGGRYDSMFEYFGGKHTPSVGFSLGMDRIIMIMQKIRPELFTLPTIDCYIIAMDKTVGEVVQTMAMKMRQNNISVITDLQYRSLKAQMREANKIGAKTVIIVGEEEIKAKQYKVKNMEDGSETLSSEFIL